MTTLTAAMAERAENFHGRRWVFKELDTWMQREPGDRYFLITGEPGSGKTAIAARLFQLSSGQTAPNGYARLGPSCFGAAHFCSAADATSIDPRNFATALALQLSARSPEYAQALVNVGDRAVNITVHATAQTMTNVSGVVVENLDVSRISAQDAFNRVVIDPLLATKQPCTILVDSLDEALRHAGDVNIVKLLSNLGGLPEGVRFVMTSRPDDRVETRFIPADGVFLSAAERSAENHDDIEQYARERLTAGGILSDGLPALIADKADGNFRYAKFVVKALIAKQMDPSRLAGLPPGLDAIYHESLTRVVDIGGKSWSADYAPVVGVLSVAQERLTIGELRQFSAQTDTAVSNCLGDLQQFVESDGANDPRYSLYHHSVTEFFQRRRIAFSEKQVKNNGFYLSPVDWNRRMTAKYLGKDPDSWDDYGLRYTATHLARAARAADAEEGHGIVQTLVRLGSDPAFRTKHLARLRNLPQLQRDLEQVARTAADDRRADGLDCVVEGTLNVVRFRRDVLRPEPLFELAARGEAELAIERLPLFDIDSEWRQIATLVMAWLAVDVNRDAAEAIRKRVVGGHALSERGQRLMHLFETWSRKIPAPPGSALPSPLPGEVIKAIVERMGGSGAIHANELLAAYQIPAVRNPSLRANEGYLSQHDGPHLVAYAQAHPGEGGEFLREYIAVHTGYQYVQYRNRSLGFLLDAVMNHNEPRWIRDQAVQITASALAGSRSDFQESLPTAVTAVRALDHPADAATIASMLQDAFHGTEQLASGRRSDPLSRSKRWLAATIAALHLLGQQDECRQLIERARKILRTGFAGYSAPACLTLAEAAEMAGEPAAVPAFLEAAASAAHNVQDPGFCVRITSRVRAMRTFWWERAFDLETTVERFVRDPDAIEFCPALLAREPFEHRDEDAMELSLGRLALGAAKSHPGRNKLACFEEALNLREGELTPLNPDLPRDAGLPDDALVRFPDPGFATWLAARFAARACAEPALSREHRSTILRSLAPFAMANPTALDTLLARLVTAERPSAGPMLDRIAELAKAAIAKPGAMGAAMPDSGIPA
jgi:hypothetical protein